MQLRPGTGGQGLATSWGGMVPPNISIDPTPGGRMVDQLAPPGHHPFLDEDKRKASWEVLNLRWRTHSSRKDQFCNGFKI